jgi:shikimate dehydrogenase
MTEKVGLIGFPVRHSVSPAMHNAAFEALGMDWAYDAMEIPPDIVRYGILEPQRHGYIGINVTVPHKREAMRYVTPDDIAREIGAVNTIDFRTMKGTNTDVSGLLDDLEAHGVTVEGANVVILGAGGAARAALYGLARAGAKATLVNRTMETAQVMLADLAVAAGIRSVVVKTLDEAVESDVDLIVNCTSAGLHPNVDASPWVEGVPIPKGVTLYDMVYRPEQTKLMRQIESAGGRTIGGLGMLVLQGAAAFKIWTGIDAPIDVMFNAARSKLAEAGKT